MPLDCVSVVRLRSIAETESVSVPEASERPGGRKTEPKAAPNRKEGSLFGQSGTNPKPEGSQRNGFSPITSIFVIILKWN